MRVMMAFPLCLLLACPEPVYDDRIGLTGVSTPAGSFAGSFALKAVLTDQADTAIGTIATGGMTFYLVTMTTTDVDGRYRAEYDVCDVVNFETAGITTVVPPATLDAIPNFSADVIIDHGTGALELSTYREHWAVADLADSDDLPTDAADPRFYDMEGDGNPGATLTASGLVAGEVYVAQRKTVSASGVITDADGGAGLCTHRKEGLVLDATSNLLKTETPRRPHADPKRSWFSLVRLSESATCADVITARDDERLPQFAPFPE
jgi:hypothetical protein